MTTSSLVLLITLKVLHGLRSCYTVLWGLLTLLEAWHKTTGFKEFLQLGVSVLWNNLPEEIWLGTLHLINLIIYNPLIIFATELMFCNVRALKITHSLFIYFFMYCRYPHAPLASTVHSTHYQHSKKKTHRCLVLTPGSVTEVSWIAARFFIPSGSRPRNKPAAAARMNRGSVCVGRMRLDWPFSKQTTE